MKSLIISNKKAKASGATIALSAIAIAIVLIAAIFAYTNLVPTSQQIIGPGGQVDTGANVAVNPTATYATKDKFSTLSIGGTSYYARDGDAATTTAIGNVNPGVQYTYWVSNGTYYVAPKVFTASSLNNNVVNDVAFKSGGVTTSLYDTDNRQTTTSGAYNTSVGVNGVANIEVSYQGVAKQSNMPFGGVMVVEKNQSFNVNGGVTCSGANIAPNTGANAFTVTYSPSATDMNTVVYKVLPTIDDGVNVNKKVIGCQFQNGGSDASGAYKVTFIPANYYVTNEGKIALDVEQAKNGLTTRTGFGSTVLTGYFS